jgi:drug/metabolite transporter superfamily protein YnfA
MHNLANSVRVWASVVTLLCGSVAVSGGFLVLLTGKYNHATGRGYMLVGGGVILVSLSHLVGPETWASAVCLWLGLVVELCGVVTMAQAAKQRKDDRESRRPVSY